VLKNRFAKRCSKTFVMGVNIDKMRLSELSVEEELEISNRQDIKDIENAPDDGNVINEFVNNKKRKLKKK
jgi:hypothetical protein